MHDGLAAGGALVSMTGAHTALYICAGGFALVGLLSVAASGNRRVQPHQAAPTKRWQLSDTWRTNRSLLSNGRLRSILWLFWLPSGVFVAGESLVVPFAEELGAPDQVGLLLAAFPAGALVGDFVVGRWVGERLQRRLVRPLLALLGAGLVAAWSQPPVAASVTAFAFGSIGFAYQLGRQRDFLEAVPESRQGQAFGLLTTGTMTSQGIGPVLAGLLADHVGASVAIGIAGSVILAYAAAAPRVPAPRVCRRDEVIPTHDQLAD